MLPPKSDPRLLRYDTSGEIMKDHSSSVSYLSVSISGRWPKPARAEPAGTAALLPEERESLLRLARGSILNTLENGTLPEPEELGVEITPTLQSLRGAFVTLTRGGQLRGCIGDIFPQQPLYRSVMVNAVHAAIHDRRFRPVTPEEIPELRIEISVLTPQRTIETVEEIVVGTHGVVLEKAGRRAVFLPQVAPEQGWDRDEMLTHLARKAGLRGDAWRDGASFTVFEARVFGEEEG
jgi:AmmeMemoRadiSam system protein A